MPPDIKHMFVLVMENRSFDHLFAFSGCPGVTPPDGAWGLSSAAADPALCDPPHEYDDVQAQIGGQPTMAGFKTTPYAAVSMAGFSSAGAPVLRTLAREFMLFDNWFASMPGPTWPNRFFFHAASSGGLDNSPSGVSTVASSSIDSLSFDFQNGTIFQKLEAAGKKWRVYHDDLFPQVLAIKHMIDPFRLNTDQFRWLRQNGTDIFQRDLNAGYDIDYTFIEPNYGLAEGGFAHGNCQHPLGSLAAGETFIRYIYETIRTSAVWPGSLFFIAYDEHGGFFDSRSPVAAVPPGDDARNHGRADVPRDCRFDATGVRVPALAISPWIPRGSLGSQVFSQRCVEHSAIVATVRDMLQLDGALTARDAAAPSLAAACSLPQMRLDTPQSLAATAADAASLVAAPSATPVPVARLGALTPDYTTEGFARIAMSVDLAMSAADSTAPIAATHPLFAPQAAIAPPSPGALAPRAAATRTIEPGRHQHLMDYMSAVSARREQKVRSFNAAGADQ